ncbi:glutamate-5-semialdehyde dehydrogenase [Thermotoga sp. KOL6]|uniref:glutamate-5-semialdehyde dehydrogenase n=1 Tax=Thermotoga sp. KOL6 TaxID=126741 RepID=UPI000C779150|nr:glutamate-5-semialdehyde dehydrogenase [Thermotoga sp. KOL6]PLV59036.1 gamma-glutamyl-phosphate reductase [Thermotoga sp. KOL6]
MDELLEKAKKVKEAWEKLRSVETKKKNEAIKKIAEKLDKKRNEILEANKEDVKKARARGVKESLVDRLVLNNKRIDGMIEACETVVKLKDPVGEVIDSWVREDGLRIARVRVPIGPIGIIYESRPNVTLETSILALKSGNTILLRGGSDALNSNKAIVSVMKEALRESEIPESSVEFIENTDRSLVLEMIRLREYLSLVIPRGGYGLISFVRDNATVPVLETGVGNCHIFVDESANLEKAISVIVNAKTQRPGTCNAAEKLLVHEKIAKEFLPIIVEVLKNHGVEVRGCEKTRKIVSDVIPATDEDWSTEYLDMIIAIKVVKDVNEAIEHIKKYSTGHSESILTENYSNAKKFVSEIDAAAVYVNASTRFTDGGQFGFGAEIGISTQRFHARGPVGLRELTTYKFVVLGDYHVREQL